MTNEKTKKIIEIVLVITLIVITGFLFFYYGASSTCTDSGGTLTKNLRCVDYSSLEYCICSEDNSSLMYKPIDFTEIDPRLK